MKKVKILMGVACLLATVACKKGEEDPALSLLSRKARLTGEWEVQSYEMNREYYNYNQLYSTSISKLEAGEIHTEIDNITWGTKIKNTDIIHENKFTFSKDGTWERKLNYNRTSVINDIFFDETQLEEVYQIKKGTWAFEGKTKGQFKNKERLVLTVVEDSSIMHNRSFARDYHDENEVDQAGDLPDFVQADKFLMTEKIEVFYILRLSNSELKLQYGEDFSNFTEDQKHQYENCVLKTYFLEKK